MANKMAVQFVFPKPIQLSDPAMENGSHCRVSFIGLDNALKRNISDDMVWSIKRGKSDRASCLRRLPFTGETTIVPLVITSGEVDGLTVVWLDGQIVLGEETGALRDTVKGLVAQGKNKVILNMHNVTLIDSAGLGALVAAYSTSKTGGASLRLCHLGTKFYELMQITRLLTLFEIYATQADAIASFSK